MLFPHPIVSHVSHPLSCQPPTLLSASPSISFPHATHRLVSEIGSELGNSVCISYKVGEGFYGAFLAALY